MRIVVHYVTHIGVWVLYLKPVHFRYFTYTREKSFGCQPSLATSTITRKKIFLGGGFVNTSTTRCFVSNQISAESYLWILFIWYALIFSRNTPKSDLFMTQVDFMLFLRLWVWSIQALPNLVWCFPNSGILLLSSPNMYRKANKSI